MAQSKNNTITFTKRDLTQKVAEKLDVPVSQMLEPVNAVFDSVRELLSQDLSYIRIEIRNFGVLEVKPTKAKPQAHNPRTNEVVFVPARKKTLFKPGKLLRAKLKQPVGEDHRSGPKNGGRSGLNEKSWLRVHWTYKSVRSQS